MAEEQLDRIEELTHLLCVANNKLQASQKLLSADVDVGLGVLGVCGRVGGLKVCGEVCECR